MYHFQQKKVLLSSSFYQILWYHFLSIVWPSSVYGYTM